jgi:hypothetical protein
MSFQIDGRAALPRSAAAYVGLVFGTGFLLGMLRVAFLVPLVGGRAAELIEAPPMLGRRAGVG